jgi:hypothetical protein
MRRFYDPFARLTPTPNLERSYKRYLAFAPARTDNVIAAATTTPASMPAIADVMGVPATPRETTPKAINASEMTARAHSTPRPYGGTWPERNYACVTTPARANNDKTRERPPGVCVRMRQWSAERPWSMPSGFR